MLFSCTARSAKTKLFWFYRDSIAYAPARSPWIHSPAFVLAIWIWNWVGSLQPQSRNGYVWYEVWNSQSRENSTFRVKIRSGFLEKKPYTLTTKLRLIVVAFKISFDFGFSDSFVLVFAFFFFAEKFLLYVLCL